MNKNLRVGVRLTEDQRSKIEQLIKNNRYTNISDFIRKAVNYYLSLQWMLNHSTGNIGEAHTNCLMDGFDE